MYKTPLIIMILAIAMVGSAMPTNAAETSECAAEESRVRQEIEASPRELTAEIVHALESLTSCFYGPGIAPISSTQMTGLTLLADPGPCDFGETSRANVEIDLVANVVGLRHHIFDYGTAYATYSMPASEPLYEFAATGEFVSLYANNQGQGWIRVLDSPPFEGTGVAITYCDAFRDVCGGSGKVTWGNKLAFMTAASAFSNCVSV